MSLITGTDAEDTLIGTSADDTILGAAANDFIDGGGAFNIAAYWTSPFAIRVRLYANIVDNDGFGAQDILANILGIAGTAFDDVIDGSDLGNYIQGFGGNDSIQGFGGDDLVRVSEGNDFVDGGSGTDRIFFLGARSEYTVVPVTGGFRITDNVANRDGEDTVLSFELFQFTNTQLTAAELTDPNARGDGLPYPRNEPPPAAGERLTGDDNPNVLTGSGGPDLIFGLGNDDTLNGADGSDTVLGGAGADLLSGAGGDDMLYGEGGNDAILGNDGSDFAAGGTGNDRIWAGAGNDYIMGEEGDDFLNGEGDDDMLVGGAGLNDLRGGDGVDALFGGAGLDYFTGGAGTDFIYAHHDGPVAGSQEFVMDFNAGGQPDYLVLAAATRFSSLIFDQGGYTWIASPAAAGGFHYVAVIGDTSAATIGSNIIWQ